MYIAGGCATSFTVGTTFGNSACGAGDETNTVYYAAINPDGSIGAWANNSAYNLPAASAAGCMEAIGGYLYYIGGENTSQVAQLTVYYNQIGTSGLPGSWATATDGLPAARGWMGCAVFNGYIYVTGGLNATPTLQNTDYISPNLSSGGNITSAWSTGTAFTTARENLSSVAVGGYLYIMGGDDDSTSTPFLDVQFIQLNPSTGAMTGAWAFGTDMPQPMSFASAFAANGYIYVIGGRTTPTSCMSTTYVASVNSTGTISRWSNSINNLASARFGMAVVYGSGYYYSLGGDNCTSIVSTNVIEQGGERSQEMSSLWTKYADLNGNGEPWVFVPYLTNAVNNGAEIDEWQLNYESAYDNGSTPAWGAITNISPLESQSTYTVNAYNSSDTNIYLSRWYELTFSIDMTNAFSFPDSAQPNISQYELYYSPPPAYRLMHGMDFRDQTKQDIDAPPNRL